MIIAPGSDNPRGRIGAPLLYCDYNASVPLRDAARVAMHEALDLGLAQGGNPSSIHQAGRKARSLMEGAREDIANALHARSRDLIFTSGATEANALALRSAYDAGARILYASGLEHDAVLANASLIGFTRVDIPVDAHGVFDVAALETRLARHDSSMGPPLVALMLANNETGVVQPVAQCLDAVRRSGALFLVDAVQAIGRLAVDLPRLGADYVSLSGHKTGGLSGIGALWVAPGSPITALWAGGGQEKSIRSGTENVLGAISFAAALRACLADLTSETTRLGAIRDAFEARLLAAYPDLTIFGQHAPRLAQTSCFGLAGLPADTLLMRLDLMGFCVSSGAACSSGKVRASRVLRAMGVSSDLAASALRASFGWDTRADHGEALADAWISCAKSLYQPGARQFEKA